MMFERIIKNSSELVFSEFGFKPEKNNFEILNNELWRNFAQSQGVNPVAQGVYLPRTLSAHLDGSSKFLPVNIFHEFFGHGLFCEHAITGKNLVSLENSLLELEKSITREMDFQKIQSIDSSNPSFKKYLNQRNKTKNFLLANLEIYEGFAMWIEYFLSKNNNLEDLFFEKMDKVVHSDYKRIFENFLNFSNEFGNFHLISHLGLPKYYNAGLILETLRRIYKSDFDSMRLAVLYGSRKPYSDIDLFIVSEKIKPFRNNWLDIFSLTPSAFESELEALSISVTDPLFAGELIKGDKEYFESLRARVVSQDITEYSINYNLARSVEQRNVSLIYPIDSIERKIAEKYSESFLSNAVNLKKGIKLLTLKNLVNS